jgi:hypothetical protein
MMTLAQKKRQGAGPLNAGKKKQARTVGGATFCCSTVFAHCEADK